MSRLNTATTPTVAIDALSAVSGGGLSVARGLARSLGEIRRDWKVLLVVSTPLARPDLVPPNVEILQYDVRSTLARWIFEQHSLRGILAEHGVDLTVLLGGFKMFLSSIPQISVWQNAHIWSTPDANVPTGLRAYIALQRVVMRATLPRVRRNIFLSDDSAQRCQKALRLDRIRSETAPIGLSDVFLSQPPPPPLMERKPVVLCVGDIYRHKRFELAIDALNRLTPSNGSMEAWIAGRVIDRAYHDHLVARVDAAGLRGRVRFLGHVDQDRLIELYRSCAVLIATSRLETFGLTPIEAMACGLPVIACRESAVPEVCGTAAQYAEATPNSISEAIDLLLDSPLDWSSLQQRGLERCRTFSWPSVAERYATIIESALREGGP